MTASYALVACALIFATAYLVSGFIRRKRMRTGARNVPGAMIIGVGTLVSGYAVFSMFSLHGPLTIAVTMGGLACAWALVAQALVGEREDPGHPNKFFH
ncbi:MAG: hypothetical protein ABW193_08445 [Luteibacter sp.]